MPEEYTAEQLAELMHNPPQLDLDRLTLIVTGSINAALVPYWLNWFRNAYPAVLVNIIITSTAERFVTFDALKHLTNGEVWRDSWDDPRLPGGSHMGFDDLTAGFGVFPSTLDYAMRLASGRSDSPSLMALQLSNKPIAMAASFPGMNPLLSENLKKLMLRKNIAFTGNVSAYSVGRKDWSGQTGFFMPLLMQALADLSSKRPLT